MPFQRKIDSTTWPSYCISYNELKRSIYELLRDESTSIYPEKEFQDLLQVELDKINLFAVIKFEDIFRSLQSAAHACSVSELKWSDPIEFRQYFIRLEESIDRIAKDIVSLDGYVRTNCEGLMKLISKFDRIVRSNASNWFVARLCREEFCNVNFSTLYILLSLTWSKYRSAMAAGESSSTTWRPPESFVRSTTKYWVRPENVGRLKADVLKHLPYLIFGCSLKDQEEFLDPTCTMDSSEKFTETQLITSIYFDNVERDMYRQRILRKEGARLVRFRWYGANEGSPDQEVFIERKIHHESWFDEVSSKDRFSIKQKEVFSFMKGERISGIDWKLNKLAVEVKALITELKLQPFIRTCYYRCAFQSATSNHVRISLDSQMSLINEYIPNNHAFPPWCRLASDVLAESELVRFPYAILEVKLADVKSCPPWVHHMLENCGAIKVQKFSKFLHAMAFLNPPDKQIHMMLPHWFSDFQQTEIAPSSLSNSAAGNGKDNARIEKILVSHEDDDFSQTPSLLVKEMKLIEPKSVYANERTFLHYSQKTAFLIAVLQALAQNNSDIACEFLGAGFGMYYLLKIYYEFKHRQTALAHKSDRLDAKLAPILAAVIVLIGVLFSFIRSCLFV